MVNIKEYNDWIIQFYKERKWYDYNSFIRLNFLTEEVGEVSRAIRSLEIGRDRPDEEVLSEQILKENLIEELGDVYDNIIILADKYQISFDEIIKHHKDKLEQRFNKVNE